MTSQRARLLSEGKVRDRALVVPLVGLALLTPPVGMIFQLDAKLGGVPVTLIYLFAVWAGLIFCAWRLSRRLVAETPGDAGKSRGMDV